MSANDLRPFDGFAFRPLSPDKMNTHPSFSYV